MAGSVLDGAAAAAWAALGVSGFGRGALKTLLRQGAWPSGSIDAAFAVIEANWAACLAGTPSRSLQNWRWRKPQLQIAAHNASPEVMLERAIVRACEACGRSDWSNQVPIASGVADPTSDRRRVIDLVQLTGDGTLRLIELKVGSDNPLYAAYEVIFYALVWLIARRARRDRTHALLDARRVDVRVLAPEAFYRGVDLAGMERVLDRELHDIGTREDRTMSFGFEILPDALLRPVPDVALLAGLDGCRR